jgi:hypothetical protein
MLTLLSNYGTFLYLTPSRQGVSRSIDMSYPLNAKYQIYSALSSSVEEGSEVPLVGNVSEGLQMIPCILELKELNNTEAEKRKKVKEISIHCFKVTVKVIFFFLFFVFLHDSFCQLESLEASNQADHTDNTTCLLQSEEFAGLLRNP